MILNSAPQNEAILSNVGEIGEFRIRNSAKAFNILSSGLYANKIRAIVRELSCNAVDSHVAAGKTDLPFDVHLPNQLEPYFSIRDYGTGLTHEQVTNIYTTYFESTKTDSNAYIGALGLGSKSPFSYTDNFTVTAIQNGVKGIYTAFINSEGVPSIALMLSEETNEPNGVEVKFAVNDRWDFDKFRVEAREVYTYFTLRPNVTGNSSFGFYTPTYESRDVIPGVHAYSGATKSVAVMGNIAYPIAVPDADTSLGDLRSLLNCGIEIHFNIGELDFQASREGLSYIPQTIDSIKKKLQELNAVLTQKLTAEANAITNLWDRAVFIYKKRESRLWTAAAIEYVKTNPLPTYGGQQGYNRLATLHLNVNELQSNYNVRIRAFNCSSGKKTLKTLNPQTTQGPRKDDGTYDTYQAWSMPVDNDSKFVISDIKTGAGSRIQFHYRATGTKNYGHNIYLVEAADKAQPVKFAEFFASVHEPPVSRRIQASSLTEKPRRTFKNVEILCLERRGGRGYRRSDEDMVWRDAGKADDFDSAKTYYYVPLSGFTMLSSKGYSSGKELYEDVKSLSGLFSGEIYGVRKKDLEDIQSRPNWKNFEEHITSELAAKDIDKILLSLVRNSLDNTEVFNYSKDVLKEISSDSPYHKLVTEVGMIDPYKGYTYNVERLFKRFAPGTSIDSGSLQSKYQARVDIVNRRYPLLKNLSSYRTSASDIAEYVNLIDAKKGI